MRISLNCMTCLKDPDPEAIRFPLQRAMADLEESGVYELKCEKGPPDRLRPPEFSVPAAL